MNDEQMQSLLEEEFRTLDTTPKDVESSTRRVMERKAGVRQRSRWWPFPVFYRRHDTPTATDTTDDQPLPIPASNGHTPTVIGRTSSMLSPVKAITAGALVFAVGGVLLIAQPFDQQRGSVPGAEVTDEAMAPAFVTGRYIWSGTQTAPPERSTSEDGMQHIRGDSWAGITVESSDPRLTGEASFVLDRDIYPGRVGAGRGTVLIENENGSWTGSVMLLIRPADGNSWPGVSRMTGTGDYEGLSVLLLGSDGTGEFEAVILPGPLPEGE
jgi:hypothetical protein